MYETNRQWQNVDKTELGKQDLLFKYVFNFIGFLDKEFLRFKQVHNLWAINTYNILIIKVISNNLLLEFIKSLFL